MTINNKVIGTHTLHPELRIYQRQKDSDDFDMYERKDVVEAVCHWKNILGEQCNIVQGSKVGIGIELLDLKYVSLLYAVSELGGINLVLDKVSANSEIRPRCRVLAPFDLYVLGNTADQSIRNVGDWYSNNQLLIETWFDYTSLQNHYYANKVAATSDNVFMMSPTSGSTGNPKVISYTHQWMLALGDYCAQTLEYRYDDRVLHLTNLHHGGSSGVFFFPTMQYCQEHYFDHLLGADLNKQKDIVKLIVEKQINKVIFPNSQSLDQILKLMPPIEHDCCFFSLQANAKSWVQESRRTGIKIISIFGATETLGPIFINAINSHSTDNHQVLNYGKPLTDFYSVEVKDRQLHVTDITGRFNIINDWFLIDEQGNYHYNSRSDLIRINEVTFGFSELHNVLISSFDELSAVLVADTTTNKIYLLISNHLEHSDTTAEKIEKINQALGNINPILKVDYVDYAELEKFLTAIKINRTLIIDHFRSKFNLT